MREAMIAVDFDFRVPNPYLDFRFRDPHLDFCFPESFRFTIICVAIAILSWPSLRLSAWQSQVHDSYDWITLWLPFVREAMIAADFDFHVPDPHLDFCFRNPHLDFCFPESFWHHNNLLGHCQPLLTLT